MQNLKTTICFSIAAVFTGLSGVPVFADYKEIILTLAGLFTALGGYFAKDASAT